MVTPKIFLCMPLYPYSPSLFLYSYKTCRWDKIYDLIYEMYNLGILPRHNNLSCPNVRSYRKSFRKFGPQKVLNLKKINILPWCHTYITLEWYTLNSNDLRPILYSLYMSNPKDLNHKLYDVLFIRRLKITKKKIYSEPDNGSDLPSQH